MHVCIYCRVTHANSIQQIRTQSVNPQRFTGNICMHNLWPTAPNDTLQIPTGTVYVLHLYLRPYTSNYYSIICHSCIQFPYNYSCIEKHYIYIQYPLYVHNTKMYTYIHTYVRMYVPRTVHYIQYTHIHCS